VALTALGRMADALASRHDGARVAMLAEDSSRRDAKALAQDAAYCALDGITETAVKAYYCVTCAKWTFSRQKKCLDEKHNGYLGDAVKKYYACKDCGTKVPVLGSREGSVQSMYCPRCRRGAAFVASTAAPVLPAPFKPQHLL
jgi:hypothetical protein